MERKEIKVEKYHRANWIELSHYTWLSFSDRTKLANVYFKIDNYNYEAKRVRDSAVIAQTGDTHSRVNGKTKAEAYWGQLSHNLMIEELKVKDLINKILQDSMWKK